MEQGDKVKLRVSFPEDYRQFRKGRVGRVLWTDGLNVMIEFNCPIYLVGSKVVGGHNGGMFKSSGRPKGKDGHCWFFSARHASFVFTVA